ncbi:electron transfer flavoprotein alpha subunit apoprotein [Pseudarcicella hirudinis]|uniref:Electron transfer flavoprotein alpha subunit apoprotein n=1 Tax=Pseudarcicella hirudinis TaxID=1079859 RepID=A0A1I5Y5U2_9BACT|nr:electron transfer flavoprotein subunit alpha/FixB family protein [Pseudarcicella hirudinis]SFQ39602.1 electron transfer flavoprotein alpha subunit apoprotein [Pseudarcicella hirudinis]
MSVLIFVELDNGAIKKSSLEAVFYGSEVAKAQGTSATVLAIGASSDSELSKAGNFGAKKVLHANDSKLDQANIQAYASVLSAAVEKESASVIVLAKSSLGDAVAARVAGKLKASIVSNITELPDLSSGFKVKRSIYTGKAFAVVEMLSDKKILAIKKNAVSPVETADSAQIEVFTPEVSEADFTVKITGTHKASGTVSLPEADIVVSAGRGLKGPENWGIVEDLAKALGAATACSKPVSDLDWRPHHEHVGQTGIKVSPNLYIACGISGAIQHLAGVNSSKVIVVINKDPEAPFFKAADYGIVGDVFDVLPKLTKAIEASK